MRAKVIINHSKIYGIARNFIIFLRWFSILKIKRLIVLKHLFLRSEYKIYGFRILSYHIYKYKGNRICFKISSCRFNNTYRYFYVNDN